MTPNISPTAPEQAVIDAAAGLTGRALPPEFFQRAALLLAELLRWNEKTRLVGHRGLAEAWINLVLDALPLLDWLGPGQLLDIGSGAGFPGLVLALALPELDVTLLDGRAKKVSFQKHAARLLNLEARVHPLTGRAGAGALPGRRFDFVCLRAVTDVPGSLALASQYCRPGGLILLPRAAADAAQCQGLGLEARPYLLPQTSGPRIVAGLRLSA